MVNSAPQARHFGLDWLRIGAFALLILYHIGLYFSPTGWVVKGQHIYGALEWILSAVSPWRLMVLFAVSGYATAKMLGNSGTLWHFFSVRSRRLLIPLAFAVIVIIPPQRWIRLVTTSDYALGFTTFWRQDYFSFSTVNGIGLPHWEHLWFVAYLWAYTSMLVIALSVMPGWRLHAARLSLWLAGSARLIIVPTALMIIGRMILLETGMIAHGMFDDWIGDIHYLPAFLFGFMLAGNPVLWTAVDLNHRLAIGLSVTSYLASATMKWVYPTGAFQPYGLFALESLSETVMAWAMVPVCFHFANRYLNHDHRWRATVAEAIFPFYIVHQTIIVVVGWILLGYPLPGLIEFLILIVVTTTLGAATYLVGRRVDWFRPAIGLAPRR